MQSSMRAICRRYERRINLILEILMLLAVLTLIFYAVPSHAETVSRQEYRDANQGINNHLSYDDARIDSLAGRAAVWDSYGQRLNEDEARLQAVNDKVTAMWYVSIVLGGLLSAQIGFKVFAK